MGLPEGDLFHDRGELIDRAYDMQGEEIAYVFAGPFGRRTIRVLEVASGRDIATHAVNTTSALSWSPDGRAIAYADLDFVGSFALLSDLYVWDIDRGARRITTGARLKAPAFTPDGRTLIAVENGAGRNRMVEVEVDPGSGATRAIVEPEGYRQFGEPAVSHDGTRIAVAEWNSGSTDIVVYSRGPYSRPTGRAAGTARARRSTCCRGRSRNFREPTTASCQFPQTPRWGRMCTISTASGITPVPRRSSMTS
jgi:dipeptidyl aminopeptidase/acylaminoacyl peptidase